MKCIVFGDQDWSYANYNFQNFWKDTAPAAVALTDNRNRRERRRRIGSNGVSDQTGVIMENRMAAGNQQRCELTPILGIFGGSRVSRTNSVDDCLWLEADAGEARILNLFEKLMRAPGSTA